MNSALEGARNNFTKQSWLRHSHHLLKALGYCVRFMPRSFDMVLVGGTNVTTPHVKRHCKLSNLKEFYDNVS